MVSGGQCPSQETKTEQCHYSLFQPRWMMNTTLSLCLNQATTTHPIETREATKLAKKRRPRKQDAPLIPEVITRITWPHSIVACRQRTETSRIIAKNANAWGPFLSLCQGKKSASLAEDPAECVLDPSNANLPPEQVSLPSEAESREYGAAEGRDAKG
ncbi:hypothetical protein FALCPG4_005100 [Fusarium falciforme]